MQAERKLIFISHANPEDNTFTLWLASRLTALGYLVWSDITKLFGAEFFWEDIEDAIRNHAAKVIVVLSRASQQKAGVLDEIAVAISVERTQGIDRFVVPIRLDDLPFGDVKPNLTRKNIIDFKTGWPDGFHKLVKVLERDHVSQSQEKSVRETSQWIEQVMAGPERVVVEPQEILSNWFSFNILPETLNFFRVPLPTEKLRTHFNAFPFPVCPYRDFITTFACLEDVDEYLPSWQIPTLAYRIPLSTILNSRPHQLESLQWPEASRMLTYLLREAWDKAMQAKELGCYQLANEKKAWYRSHESKTNDWFRYVDQNGAERRRQLVGYSKMRKVYWHYALESWPFISKEPRLMLKPHVVFSEDGKTPLSNDKRMHTLRRGFCRNWWNARWRDLMLAYMASIADENGKISLPIGTKQVLAVNPTPMLFQTSVSLVGITVKPNREDEADEQFDKSVDRSDWDFEEEFEEGEFDEGLEADEEDNY